MFDLLASGPLPDAWPALALPLYAMSVSAAVIMLVVVLLAVPTGPDARRRTARVRRLQGTRAA